MDPGATQTREPISNKEYERDYVSRFHARNFLVSLDRESGRLTEVYTGTPAARILALPGDRISWVVAGAEERVTHKIVFPDSWPFTERSEPIVVGASPSPVLTVAETAVPPRGGWYAYGYSIRPCRPVDADPDGDIVIGGPGQDLNDG